jgi:raffinose/stachyose/melibiose transport system substrate-binding protein
MGLLKTSSAAVALVMSLVALPSRAEELVIWTRTNQPQEEKALRLAMSQFEAANPGTTVKLETRATDEHKSALRLVSQSKIGPDIFFMWAGLGLAGEYVKAGLSAPLDTYYKKYKWDDVLLPMASSYTAIYPPSRHGVPYTLRGEGLYYNKALFKKAGIEKEPTTYAELVEVAKKLKAVGIPAITFGGSVNWHLMRLMDSLLETKCGAKTHDALKAMTVKWSETACATDAFKELNVWTSQYLLKPFMSYDQPQSRRLFFSDRAAMMLEGDWMVNQLKDEKKDLNNYGIFAFPSGTNRLYGFGVNYYVSANSKNKDLAAKFLDHLVSQKVQQETLGAFGALSVNRNVEYKDLNVLDKAWIDLINKYKDVYVNGDQGFPLDVTTEYFRVINGVATDTIEPAKAAATFQAFLDKR